MSEPTPVTKTRIAVLIAAATFCCLYAAVAYAVALKNYVEWVSPASLAGAQLSVSMFFFLAFSVMCGLLSWLAQECVIKTREGYRSRR